MTDPSRPTAPFDGWQPARLIPAPGSHRAADAVKAASETVLAVLGAVPTLAREVLRVTSAPRGRVATYTSLSLEDGQTGTTVRPDGALVVGRGDERWTCLLHARTGKDTVRRVSVEKLVRVAVQHGIDAVLTVSPEISVAPGVCPVNVERDVRHSVELVHLSWFDVLTRAVLCRDKVSMDDPAQGLLVSELVDFLRHPRSHTARVLTMGEHWASVRSGARSGKLNAKGNPVREVVERWERLGQSLALRLSQHAVERVTTVVEKGQTLSERASQLANELTGAGSLSNRLRVPGAAGRVTVRADLAERRVEAVLEVRAPREGAARARIGWLMRQLREAPEGLGVEAVYGRSATGVRPVEKVREDPDLLLLRDDDEREPSRFRLVVSAPVGTSATTFPRTVEHLVLELNDHVVQRVKAWKPPVEIRVPDEPPTDSAPLVLDPRRFCPPADLLSGFPGADTPGN